MSTSPSSRSDDELEAEAAEWVCEREEGFQPARARAFATWLAADARHAAALARVEQTLDLLSEMPTVRAPLQARVGQSGAPPMRSGRRLYFPAPAWLAGLAAVLVIGLVIAALWAPRSPEGVRYVSGPASQRIPLSDGSVVDLNAGTEMWVDLTPQARRLTLAGGEAHFRVAPDKARPFIVTAGGVAVRAVGTVFNVRLDADGVDVLVVEGRVELAQDHARSPQPEAHRPQLGAGERATVAREITAAPTITRIDAVEMRGLLAWQNQLTHFTDVPLSEIIERLNFRSTTQITLADAELGQRRVGGVIALDQIDLFLRLLEQDGDIVVDRRNEHEIVLRQAP